MSRATKLTRWAAERAVSIDGSLDALDDALVGKRFAFIGESNHFIHEKYAYRIAMARYLHSRGWTVFGEELAWSDGVRISRFLQTGDESWLDRVTTFGYRGDQREDRKDEPTGVFKDSFDRYPTEPMAAEQRRFAHALRDTGITSFFAFDVDYNHQAGYLHLEEHDMSDEALRGFRRVPGESLLEESQRLHAALELVDPADRALYRTARTLAVSHAYNVLVLPAPDFEATRPGMALREDLMKEHLTHVMDREGPDAKIALFSHNLHLAKDEDRISAPGGVGPGGGKTESLGTWLTRRHPGEVFASWMLEFDGHDSVPFDFGGTVHPVKGTLNAALADAGDDFIVATPAGSPFDDGWGATMMYGHAVKANIAEQADAIYFRRTVSPLRIG